MTPPPIIFFKAAAAILLFKDPSQMLIRSSEIPRIQQLPNLHAIQPTVHKLSCPQAFLAAILKNGRLWLGALQKLYRENSPVT